MRLCLEARQLACERDGRWLFRGLDVALKAGEVLRVEGPNGSGKTTLLKILCGQIADVDGEVRWQGRALPRARADLLANLLYLGHAPGIKANLTAIENLRWYQALSGDGCPDAQLEAALAEVGLAGFEDVPTAQLSAGQKRRVTLARLALSRRALWVLDEPFTAIDVAGVAALEHRLSDHAARGGAVLVTTHHPLSNVPGLRRLTLDGHRQVAS
ncbi:cytochrome c biogenesis heme-transporting ATPase CcmA [Halomonas litopenaei]|uniref:cytochrome c biogenesis heme-transporting ATPase CcmA n=1 Tax=Halomonas litopenaei TaxID=2109328 RepID=UPI000C3B29E7|nr:heme ABC transporter ATP-binding protein CcmA [Halomonas sp.]